MVLVIFGTGVDCQVVLSTSPQVASSPKGSYLSISFGWAIGAALGVWVSGGISGGHLNPVVNIPAYLSCPTLIPSSNYNQVTLAQVVYRRFPLRKFPIYFLAQLLGAFFGALITYANYWHAIDLFEGGGRTVPGTAALFATYPLDYMTAVSSFFSEFLGTAILLIVVFAITDTRNIPPPAGLVPVAIFLTIAGIGIALGMETSYAINPARDLGPRMMTAIFYGREGADLEVKIATFAGGLVGAGVYDLFVFTGDESRINSTQWRGVRMHDRSKKDDPRDPKSALEGSGVV
ncbi:hypothetical protein FRB99_002799 [Tulasnella sp. 403]|nr:hypothetical protein FRB99_002799 [Tulasnella sp. 403]